MNRRTKRKNERKSQRKNQRKSLRKSQRKVKRNSNYKQAKRSNKKRTSRKYKQRGGDDGEFKLVLLSILNDTYIPFLPTATTIKQPDLQKNYLECVSAFDLLTIIGKNPKFAESKSITNIVKEVDTNSKELFNLLGDLTKIPVSKTVMSNFMINCNFMKNNGYLNRLREYVLECEDELSNKYVDWYKVALGLSRLDDEFEQMIKTEIQERRIFLDTDKFRYGLNILSNDTKVKSMFKKRIIECGYKPQGFFDKLMGTISWDSYNECFTCSDNSCTVYLDDNYKSFLNKPHKIQSVDKIKILIFVELRLRALSKHITLEALRITGKKHSKVKSILKTVYKDDMNNNRRNKNDLKQMIMKPFLGGAVDEGGNPLTPQPPTPQPPTPQPVTTEPTPQPAAPQPVTTEPTPQPVTTEPTPQPVAPQPVAPQPTPDPLPAAGPTPDPTPQPTPEPLPAADPAPEPTPSAEPIPEPGPTPQPVAPSAEPTPQPVAPEPVPATDKVQAEQQQPIQQPISEPSAEIEDIEDVEETAIKNMNQQTEIEKLDEKTIRSTSVIYLTFNSNVSEEGKEVKTDKPGIIKEIKKLLLELTGANPNTIQIYRVRFGPETTSIEVGITITGDETMSEEEIKKIIVDSVIDKSIKKKLLMSYLGLIKDIYFDGISDFPGVTDLPSQYKRVIVEIPIGYPETKDSKIEFEKNAIQYIHEFLDPTMDPIRIQLERVAKVPKDNSRTSVQFLIMNGFRETKTPNEIIMNFKNRYGDGTTDFATSLQLKKVVFGDPSIIIDGSENDKTNTFVQEKKEAEIVDTSTLKSIEEDPVNVSYYGCNLTTADLTKNIISASTPLPYECNETIEQFFKRP